MATLRDPYGSTEMMGFTDTWDSPTGYTMPEFDMSSYQPPVEQPPVQVGGVENMPTIQQPGQQPTQDVQPAARPAYDYQALQSDWMGSDQFSLDEAGVKALAEKWGLNYGGDSIQLPHGGWMDIVGNMSDSNTSNNARNWTAVPDYRYNSTDGNWGGSAPVAGTLPDPVGNPVDMPKFGPETTAPNKGLLDSDVMNQLRGMFPDGAFNQGLVDRRTEGAREDLQRFEKGRNSQNRALLADRGLIGSGAEATAQNSVEDDLATRYAQAVSGIYGDESERADSRMMQALQLAAGMTQEEARLLLDSALGNRRLDVDSQLGNRKIDSDTALGWGNIDLGQQRNNIDWTLGSGRLNLDQNQGDMDAYIRLLDQLYRGADTSSGGYI